MESMPPPPHDSAECEEVLRRAWEVLLRRWTHVDLPADVFIRHVLQLLPEVCAEDSFMSLLEKYDLEGLYLACACVNGVGDAVKALEQDYIAQLPMLLRRLELPEHVLDDVCQQVRTHLLVGAPKGGPRLATYTGRGGLMKWIYIIATRMALKHRKSNRETPDENVLVFMEDQAAGTNPELAMLKHLDSPEVKRALRDAFNSLPKEQRYLLRLHYFERLPTTRMGVLLGKDQSTISRWLKEARERVYEETKRLLQERLDLTTQEFESLMDAVKSRFDMSLSQIFEDEKKDEEN